MPNLHSGLDSRRPATDHWCQLGGIHALEWLDIQFRNDSTGELVQGETLLSLDCMFLRARLTQSLFERWFGLTTTAGW